MYDMFAATSITYVRKRWLLAEYRTHDTAPSVGRKKQWPVRLTLPLTDETVERLDAVRRDGESRLDVIREGIDRELRARSRLDIDRKKPRDSVKLQR